MTFPMFSVEYSLFVCVLCNLAFCETILYFSYMKDTGLSEFASFYFLLTILSTCDLNFWMCYLKQSLLLYAYK